MYSELVGSAPHSRDAVKIGVTVIDADDYVQSLLAKFSDGDLLLMYEQMILSDTIGADDVSLIVRLQEEICKHYKGSNELLPGVLLSYVYSILYQ